MSGHSKWHNIQNTKNAQDAKRTKLFSKLSRNIYIAAKLGGSPDEKLNPMLKDAIIKAKSFSLPGDKIEKAINRVLGILNKGEVIYEKTYEFYGIGGDAMFLIDCETDNPNRTYNNLKDIIGKNNGKIVSEGSISWNFKELMKVNLYIKTDDIKTLILDLLDMEGIEDIKDKKSILEVLVNKTSSANIIKITKIKYPDLLIKDIEIVKIAKNLITLSNSQFVYNKQLYTILNESDDVVNIWSNVKDLT